MHNPVDFQPRSLITYALAGMVRFRAARDLAQQHGPELFEPGPVRVIAAEIIAGRRVLPTADPAFHLHVNMIRAEVTHALRYGLPVDEDHAVHLIRCLIEDAHLPLLAGSLRWAASEVERKASVSWIRRKVMEMFDLAEGFNVTLSRELLTDPEKAVKAA